jgi:hypothetical protein
MARLVRIHRIPRGAYPLWALPEVPALERYKTCVSKRVEDFPATENLEVKDVRTPTNTTIETYSHRLSYDAEAILWLLLNWAIQIQPKSGDHKNRIPGSLWVALTSGDFINDPRRLLVPLKGNNLCHPDYAPLDELLNDLFEQLSGYQEYIELLSVQKDKPPQKQEENPPHKQKKTPLTHDPSRVQVDYLHEAFQRILLQFIVDNSEMGFMRTEISHLRRRKGETAGAAQSLKTPLTGSVRAPMTSGSVRTPMTSGSVRTREQMVDGEESAGEEPGRKKRKQKKENDPETREEQGAAATGGRRTRAQSRQYVARTFPHHVGADIPTGAQRPNRPTANRIQPLTLLL